MQVKDKIIVYEDGKKSARTLTPAQQNKLLLQARSGGIEKKKIQKPIEEEEDEVVEYENETEGSQSQSELDLEELIRLRTEKTFIKQQQQDAIKQLEKYKQKIKGYKYPKKQEEIKEEEPKPEPQPAPQMRDQQYSAVMDVALLIQWPAASSIYG
ncbi:MAG: hypothetical protein EZS28_006417 [Streblomastix strix]|uniref:Uncharacterized protein n=1 Tax=Streblomastix strix TaxID=222440 RepID=A0A5J4WV53_9EUKA|nr:MAG: hypothetical protein EZS28_006417 [Streblomastix strix]